MITTSLSLVEIPGRIVPVIELNEMQTLVCNFGWNRVNNVPSIQSYTRDFFIKKLERSEGYGKD